MCNKTPSRSLKGKAEAIRFSDNRAFREEPSEQSLQSRAFRVEPSEADMQQRVFNISEEKS
ncbi:hypothetical protein BELL_0649g00030 [Botrytis elliptica]|uniref:Uncharacterized protein n=1 Tax=Botrytis elliptica TaxID=278938 RepID=A0A4Z1JB55_9HELO|nr:hypothetical protein BELL_0649g00030 [Botrytis elliptica]